MNREKFDRFAEWLEAFGTDKWIHVVAVMVVAWAVAMVISIFGLPRAFNGLMGVAATIVAGVWKEAYDKRTTGLWDNKDLVADGVGMVLFYLIYVV